MTELKFLINLSRLRSSDAFLEASKDELKILLLIASDNSLSLRELAALAKVSEPRAASAVTLWKSAGIITAAESLDKDEPECEFSENALNPGIDEERSIDVATSIRDEGLAVLIDECAALMDRPSLSTQEIKNISAIYTQLALSAEYILTLAAHMKERKSLSAKRLAGEAEKLVRRGIDNVEDLEKYIADSESASGAEWEFRRLIGIYGRNTTKSEREYFKRWSEDFGYSSGIVNEAYDIAVANTGKISLAYMDKILSAWHTAGCKTVSECIAHSEEEKKKKTAEKKKGSPEKKKSNTESTPKYSSFDVNEAMLKALQRSYGDDGSEDND